jgi:hypothetical protein
MQLQFRKERKIDGIVIKRVKLTQEFEEASEVPLYKIWYKWTRKALADTFFTFHFI